MKFFIHQTLASTGKVVDCEIVEFKNERQAMAYCWAKDLNSPYYKHSFELVGNVDSFINQYTDYPKGRNLG